MASRSPLFQHQGNSFVFIACFISKKEKQFSSSFACFKMVEVGHWIGTVLLFIINYHSNTKTEYCAFNRVCCLWWSVSLKIFIASILNLWDSNTHWLRHCTVVLNLGLVKCPPLYVRLYLVKFFCPPSRYVQLLPALIRLLLLWWKKIYQPLMYFTSILTSGY